MQNGISIHVASTAQKIHHVSGKKNDSITYHKAKRVIMPFIKVGHIRRGRTIDPNNAMLHAAGINIESPNPIRMLGKLSLNRA